MPANILSEEKDRLGIKDELEVEKPAKKEQAAVPAGKSALLSDALRGQLKGIFGKMESDVTMVSIVDESLPKIKRIARLLVGCCGIRR